MPNRILREVRAALTGLNPNEVRQRAEQPVRIGLVASCGESFALMEDFLAPPVQSQEKRITALQSVFRIGEDAGEGDVDFILAEQGMPVGNGGNVFVFNGRYPRHTVQDVLDNFEDLHLPLSRLFAPFRAPVADAIIGRIARENALFSLITALPASIAGLLSSLLSVGEFASDTTVITGNQIRMAFLLAAASDLHPGYAEQKTEIASLIAGAFGFRSLARLLASRIPLGAGLIPKAAIAFAGTWVAGKSLERLYEFGYPLSAAERGDAVADAYERGKYIVHKMLEAWRSYPLSPAHA